MPSSADGESSRLDHATFADPTQARTKHIHLDWSIDWEHTLVKGQATLELELLTTVDKVVLDTRSLSVSSVTVDGADAKFSLGEEHDIFGTPLEITLPSASSPGSNITVMISYATSSQSSALSWLTPGQTKGGKHPYLFSQSQSINGRALLPCQDTPGVKATFSSAVRSTLPVVMSGLRTAPPLDQVIIPGGEEVVYEHYQKIPIPSYLITIASANLAYRAFDASVSGGRWTSGVWAEPEVLEAAHWEFKEDTANFVALAEKLTGNEYVWGRYDVLVQADTAPFGGMENPGITFVTPTLLAGDRSLTDVIAHEISHSWSGNQIGCATWKDFWLNEGWTTYFEELLVGETHGPAHRGLSQIIGFKAMTDSLEAYEQSHQPGFQRLVTLYDRDGDPEDAFSSVPYHKGAALLFYLETLLGKAPFLTYAADYVSTFKGKSITTADWKSHLFAYWEKQEGGLEKLKHVDWDAWLHGEGVTLPVKLTFDTSLADEAYALAARWKAAGSSPSKLAEFSSEDVKSFSTAQTSVFLEKLQLDKLPAEAAQAMDAAYHYATSTNAEIAWRFLELALATGPAFAEQAAVWVQDKGRMKFCRPIFKSLFKVRPELAVSTFQARADFYHPIARRLIAKDLGLSK